MSTEPKSSSTPPSVVQQRRQANILLLRLQWLFILLLIIAVAWLYSSQQRFETQIVERLQSNEQVVTRLNEMDDRLFAISQQSVPTPRVPVTNQAQNQLDLLRIQMQAADRLLTDNNYSAAINLLKGLQWQLSQSNNEIAPALTIIIKQSLNEDIERLQARSAQPSQWQLQNLAIQDIQTFLHSYEGDNNDTNARVSAGTSEQRSNLSRNVANQTTVMTKRQLTIHEVIMTLNLAIQASNMRESDQVKHYLSQARTQLQSLVKTSTNNNAANPANERKANRAETKANDSATMKVPENIAEVIVWLEQLSANTPTAIPLLTMQVLDQPQE